VARLLAIDWDRTEARYVVADARGNNLMFEDAGTLPLSGEKDTAASRAQLGEALKAALAGKASRATALLSIDRGQIDLVSLTLPPASDAELPEMVRNLAMRENSAIGEDAALDFVPEGEDASKPRKVTAVALSQARLEQIQEVITGAGLSAKTIALRPYAVAALVKEQLADSNETCLVALVLAEEVDLVVLSAGRPVFWRTLRQPNASHDSAAAQRLLAEIQRTLLIAQPQFPGQTVTGVYLCGGLEEHPSLTAALRDGLSLPLTLVDPFAANGGLTTAVENPGRFAPLVGLLASEARGESPAVDFLHPRRRPAPPDRRRIFALAGAAAALLVLLSGYRVWSDFSAADEQIADLTAELDRLSSQFKQAGQKQKAITAIQTWSQSDVNWLDELRDLSLRFPSGRDAVVLRMGLSHSRESGGTIDLVGIVRDPIVVSRIESNLRDEHHQISSRHMQERLQEDNYSWHFESTIGVTPREPKHYVSHLPPDQRPPAPASKSKLPANAKSSAKKASP
jgi:Tfp pilus assembly PilM family ATPase